MPRGGLTDGTITLRLPEERDARRIVEICSDPEISRWTHVPSPYTLEDARAWIALAASERERGRALHTVAVSSRNDVLGAVSLRVHRLPEPYGDIGYWVAAGARRTGVGTRAVDLLRSHALDELGVPYVEIVVSPQNDASLAVARRAGFERYASELREFKGEMVEFEVFRRHVA